MRQRQTAEERREKRRNQPTRTRTTRTSAAQRKESGWNGELHEFTVQKPFCAPCRSNVYTALQPYGVPIFDYEEWTSSVSIAHMATIWKIELKTFENLKYGPAGLAFLPTAQCAKFRVPANRARWVYYLLRSSGRLAVTGGKRREWDTDSAADHLPKAWDAKAGVQAAVAAETAVLIPPGADKAWVETNCSKGNEIWKQVQEIRAKAKEDKK